jgi:uncharacterized protein
MTRTVTVTGQGSARVVPDAAVVRVAVVHRAGAVAAAFAGVASGVAAVTETARGVLEESRIGSRDLNLWPTSDNEGRPDGFECRHALEIRCPTLELAGSLLGTLVETVGDRLQVEGVTLEVTDDSAAQAQSRDAAYADAVARATALATVSGTVLGAVLQISEGGGGRSSGALRAFAMDSAAKVEFQPGEQAHGMSLEVTFELADPTS